MKMKTDSKFKIKDSNKINIKNLNNKMNVILIIKKWHLFSF